MFYVNVLFFIGLFNENYWYGFVCKKINYGFLYKIYLVLILMNVVVRL